MKFEEILPKLLEGKKVRQAGWSEEKYIETEGGYIYNDRRGKFRVTALHFKARDWELYEEPKSEINMTEKDIGKRVRLTDNTYSMIIGFIPTTTYSVQTFVGTFTVSGLQYVNSGDRDINIVEILD